MRSHSEHEGWLGSRGYSGGLDCTGTLNARSKVVLAVKKQVTHH